MTEPVHTSNVSPLAGLRVLDLSRRYAYYCGKLFADMGADVLLIEQPNAGCELRREPPSPDDREDPEYSIPFFYFNTSKRGITIDLDQPVGCDLFKQTDAFKADLSQASVLTLYLLPGMMIN